MRASTVDEEYDLPPLPADPVSGELGSLKAQDEVPPPEPAAGPRASIAALAGSAAIAVAVVAGYVTYLVGFATNGVYWDEWNWVELLGKSYSGSLTLGDLWAQHNENRIFFSNVIALALGQATGFSDVAFMYLGAAFLIAAVAVMIIALRRDLFQHPLAYTPALFILFSLAQYENTLWAFQFNWFMAVLCLTGALALLTAHRLDEWRFVAAVTLAVIASYSLLPGLTVWAAGLVALSRPRRSVWIRLAWCAAGAATAGFYLLGFNFGSVGGPPLSQFPSRLPAAIDGFFVAVGSVAPGLGLTVAALLGVMITGCGCLVLVSWVRLGRADRVLTFAAALIVAGLLFDGMLMPGRLSAGAINGTLSRYATFNLLLLAGTYLGAVRAWIIAGERGLARPAALSGAFAGLVFVLVCIQVPVAILAGVSGGVMTRAYHAEAANLTANRATAPRPLVEVFDYPPSYAYFETQAAFLEANHLNVFADGESTGYQQSGVVAGGAVTSPLPVPPELGSIRSNAGEWRAWLALSSVYEQRPDLQRTFPGLTVHTSREMLAWALNFGLDPNDPLDSAVLQPYAGQYAVWLAETASH